MKWCIGIDQSYSGFGLCAILGNEVHEQVTAFSVNKYGAGADRLNAISDHICEFLDPFVLDGNTIEHICMEGYSPGSKFGRETLGELGAIVKLTLVEYHAEIGREAYPTIVPPSSLKKFATGSGNADKKEVIVSIEKKWGRKYSNDNLADAFVLAKMAFALSSKSVTLLDYEKEALTKLKRNTQWNQNTTNTP